MIDFEITIPEEVDNTPAKTWYNVNDLKKSEIQPYKKGYNPLNPFKIEDKVILRLQDHDRYSLIEGITPHMVGSISEVLGNNMVNIAYWDTQPSVIKNVPVTSVRLASNKRNKLTVAIRVLFKVILRKIFDPNKLPKHIKAELKQYWG
jgi:hypothetical protein